MGKPRADHHLSPDSGADSTADSTADNGGDRIDPEALRELAIFPLPNAVLLPGGVLPLHVFEPRYRDMTRDCLAGSCNI